MKKIICGFVCWLFCFTCLAGNINYDSLKEKYPEAKHLVLDRDITVFFFRDSLSKELKARAVHKLSLLAMEDGAAELTLIQMPFSSSEEVNILSARYFKLLANGKEELAENVKIKLAEVKDYFIDNIFYQDLKVKQFSSSLPVKEQMLLHYSYEIIYNDLKFLSRFYMQEQGEDVLRVSVSFQIPDDVEAEVREFNFRDEQFKKETLPVNGGKKLSYVCTSLKKHALNEFAPPANYYLPHLVLLTKSYTREGQKVNVLASVNDLYAWYNSLIKQLSPNKEYLKQLSDQLVKGKNTPEEKTDAIFRWVQKNITYVAFEDGIAGFKPDEAHNVCELRYGDCKGMANLLVNLLSAQGLDARHTWIGTRHLNYDYSLPSMIVDNHMICALRLNQRFYFLDATSKTTPWNHAPDHIQGKQALVAKGDKYEIIKIPVDQPEENIVSSQTRVSFVSRTQLQAQGELSISGNYYEEFQDFIANFSLHEANQAERVYLGRYFRHIQSKPVQTEAAAVAQIVAMGQAGAGSSRKHSIRFEGKSLGQIADTGDKMFLFCDLDQSYSQLFTDKNDVPIYFSQPHQLLQEVTYELPPDLKVASLPDQLQIEAPDKSFAISISYQLENNLIRYRKKITINTLLVEPAKTKEWKEMSAALTAAYQTPVVITLQ